MINTRKVIDTITGIEETVIKCPHCKMQYSVKALLRTSDEENGSEIIDALETIGIMVDKNEVYGVFWYNQIPDYCPYCGKKVSIKERS